jgi:HAE1 family hydrophobic/amphiphilic exporter-1
VSLPQKVVKRPILITVVFTLVVIVGLVVLSSVSIDLFPENENRIVMVMTAWTGNGPESVENLVTRILESSLSGVQGLSNMTSTSSEGSSMIMLEFTSGTNLDSAVNSIRDKIDSAKNSLPDDATTPTIMRFSSSSMPIMRLTVRGNRTAEELRAIADNTISSRLAQAAGVANVSVSGGRTAIIRVDISQNRLAAYDLTIGAIASALATQNVELGAGSIVEAGVNYSIKTTGAFSSVEEIADAVVAHRNDYGVRLADVANVYSGYADVTSLVTINGESGIQISVTKQSDSNSVKVANAVYAKVKEIQKVLPAGVTLAVLSDDTTLIRSTITDLVKSITEGAVLAMAFVFLFMRSLRPTIAIGLSIPISLIVTLLCMYFANLTLNMMTMTGLILGVGMIVDASIVILDNIQQYKDRGTKVTVAATLGAQEMLMPITASNLTHICIFIPLLMFSDQIGQIGMMFKGAIFTIVISMVASWLVAVLLVPVMASRYLPVVSRKEKPLRNPVLRWLDNVMAKGINGMTAGYRAALKACLNHRVTTIIVVAAALAVTLMFTPNMNIVFSPPMSDDSISVTATLPLGTTLDQTNDVLQQIAADAQKEVKGIKTIIVQAGGSSFSFMGGSTATYSGTISITMEDESQHPDSAETVKAKLRTHYADFPQASFAFGQGRMRMGQNEDIDIVIRSTDLALAMSTAKGIRDLMKAKVPDALEPSLDTEEGLPQVEVVIDRQRAYSFGLTVNQIASEIKANMKGSTATAYHEGGEDYNVVLRLDDADRQKVLDLEKIFVLSTSGQRVPLSDIATVTKGVGPVSIARENQARTIHLTASLSGKVRADAVEKQIKTAIAENMVIDENVTLEYKGSWQEITSISKAFVYIILLAILLVFGVMAGQYESFKDPLINIFTIPLVAIGVVGIHSIMKIAFSMYTLVGLVMLVGIVVSNGIILVDYTNLLRKRGVPLMQACVQAGTNRLRPVLLTAITTILGMVPMGFFPSENSTMMQPIGLCVIGGLTSATFITLLVIPVIYYLFNKGDEKRKTKEVAHAAA